MRFLCPSCERLVAVSAARLEADRVTFTCSRCGAVERIELTPSSPSGSTPQGDAGDRDEVSRCPKCREPRSGGEACSKCGLVFERWLPDAASAPEEVVALWTRLEERWDDEALHSRFVTACLDAGALSHAARCYRSRDDDVAKRQLARLTALGVQAMKAAEKPGRLDPRIFRTVGWVVFFVLCVALLVAAFSFRGR